MEHEKTTFLQVIIAGIKENFRNRVANWVIIGATALISVVGSYVGGAIIFQSNFSQRLFNVEAAQLTDHETIEQVKSIVEELKQDAKVKDSKIDAQTEKLDLVIKLLKGV